MAADDLIDLEGEVVAINRDVFTVRARLEDAQGNVTSRDVTAHLAGKLRQFHIRVVLGDKVTVQVSPYDPTKGRILYRHK